MPNAGVSADGGALPPIEPAYPFQIGPYDLRNGAGRSPLDVATMPSGDPVQIALTALRRHTVALNALRFGAEAELSANIFARVKLEGLIERLISALDLLDPDDELQEDFGDQGEATEYGRDFDDEPSLGWSLTAATTDLDGSPWFGDGETTGGEWRPSVADRVLT